MKISQYPNYFKNLILLIPLGIAISSSCSSSRQSNISEIPTLHDAKEIDKYLNQSVFIQGKAAHAKMGALIVLRDSSRVWIDGLQNWPTKYYSQNHSQHIKVRGVLVKEEFYPSVIDDADSLIYSAGFTVLRSEYDGKACHIYVLKDAKY